MLNREVCTKCWGRVPAVRVTESGNRRACKVAPFEGVDPEGLPPDRCPYAVEHVISEGRSVMKIVREGESGR